MIVHPELSTIENTYLIPITLDKITYTKIPKPGDNTTDETVLFPTMGFIDPVSKILVVRLILALNRAETHIQQRKASDQALLSTELNDAKKAEQMLFKLVDQKGRTNFEYQYYHDEALYTKLQLAILRFTITYKNKKKSVSTKQLSELKTLLYQQAKQDIQHSNMNIEADKAYLSQYRNAMLLELCWCISTVDNLCHAHRILYDVKTIKEFL